MTKETPRAIDYKISAGHADLLRGIVCLPGEVREMALIKMAERMGGYGMVQLFAQFIGLANSVVANNREMVEIILITEGGLHPDHSSGAKSANLPTIFGALSGILLADGVTSDKLCPGCAFRLGTSANQSPVTTGDADLCVKDSDVFMCHEELDRYGRPTKGCAGYATKLNMQKRTGE